MTDDGEDSWLGICHFRIVETRKREGEIKNFGSEKQRPLTAWTPGRMLMLDPSKRAEAFSEWKVCGLISLKKRNSTAEKKIILYRP